MDPVVNGSEMSQEDSKETSRTEDAVTVNNKDTEHPVDSHSEKTDPASKSDKTGECGEPEQPSASAIAAAASGPVADDTSKPLEDTERMQCSAQTVQEENVTVTHEKSHDEVSSQEAIQEKVEVTDKQQTNLQQTTMVSSETSSVQRLSSSVTEELSKFSSELTSTQIIKQTMTSSSQETTVSNDSFTIDANLKITAEENLLDPEKVSELRKSPYYDSLIANRISMESHLPKTVQQKDEQKLSESDSALEEQPDDECPITPDDRQPATETGQHLSKEDKAEQGASASQSDFASKTVSSLKDACQEAVKASSQVNHTQTATSGIFKVKKFEAKSFSEVKTSSDWSFEQSSLFKTGEDSSVSLQQISDFTSTSESQVQSTDDMGVQPANEDGPFRFSPNAYKPPPEEEMDFTDLPRKKKMFSSSSFYEEPNAIYPTVEEQVELCRKIADSLSDDTNKKSKGANMFFKRVKRAEKWVVESMGTADDSDYYEHSRAESVGTPDPSKAPYVRVSKGPPQLKLILDPRHLLDMKRLRQEGINIVEHNAVSPEICLDLVKDLNSPTGRGALLFAKRKKKSEEWVVDEEKVKQLLRERESGYTSSPEPPATVPYGGGVEPLVYPRVQMVKTPWAAAMESPIGSCANAFRDVHPNEVAESVIRAAETKVMTYPAPVKPVIEPVIKPESNVQQQNYPSSTVFSPAPVPFTPVAASQQAPKRPPATSSFKAGVYTADPYKPRAPRGWTGTSLGGSQYVSVQPNFPFAAQEPVQPQVQPQIQQQVQPMVQPQRQPQETPVQGPIPIVPSYKLTHQPSVMKSYSFANFNKSPKAWSEAASGFQNVHMKPVKPPSVLVQ